MCHKLVFRSTLSNNYNNVGIKVIDLSADFRIRDVAVWEQWYGQPHLAQDLLDCAVYGLPEFNRAKIIKADLVACAGCYPTSVQIGLLLFLTVEFQLSYQL